MVKLSLSRPGSFFVRAEVNCHVPAVVNCHCQGQEFLCSSCGNWYCQGRCFLSQLWQTVIVKGRNPLLHLCHCQGQEFVCRSCSNLILSRPRILCCICGKLSLSRPGVPGHSLADASDQRCESALKPMRNRIELFTVSECRSRSGPGSRESSQCEFMRLRIRIRILVKLKATKS